MKNLCVPLDPALNSSSDISTLQNAGYVGISQADWVPSRSCIRNLCADTPTFPTLTAVRAGGLPNNELDIRCELTPAALQSLVLTLYVWDAALVTRPDAAGVLRSHGGWAATGNFLRGRV